ncbi:26S proteasome non-ATPase regulatory subunit 5, partial [Paragonimus westermani]
MECSLSEVLNLIEKLSTQGGQISEYECLVALLSSVKDEDLKVIARSCDIMQLFSSMNLNEKRFMEAALKLANTLFSAVPTVELVNVHQAELLQALHSERTVLMEFVLTKLKDSVHQVKSHLCCIPEAIIHEVICLVAHEDLKVSKAAVSFLSVIGTKFVDGVERLFNPSSVLLINSTCVTSEQMLRIVEMATYVAVRIPSKFKQIEASGILRPLLKGLADEDSLTNLNFIEIAKDVVLIPDGYEWLVDSGALNNLLVRLKGANEVASGHLLLPGYLLFFGCLALQNPEYWLSNGEPTSRNTFLSSLVDAGTNPDPTLSLAALESIGQIAGRHKGRKVLHELS